MSIVARGEISPERTWGENVKENFKKGWTLGKYEETWYTGELFTSLMCGQHMIFEDEYHDMKYASIAK